MKIQQSRANRAHGWNRALVHCGVLLAVGVLAVPAWGYSSGVAGFAGAPGDPEGSDEGRTCVVCHTGGASPGELFIDVQESVEVGREIPVTVYFEGTTPTRWGFNLIAIDKPVDVLGEPTGELTVTDAQRTKKAASNLYGSFPNVPFGNGWHYLTHTSSGTTSVVDQTPGWEMSWIAPDDVTAEVTFYATFNAANGFGTAGDHILSKQVTIEVVPEPGLFGATAVSLASLAALRNRRRRV